MRFFATVYFLILSLALTAQADKGMRYHQLKKLRPGRIIIGTENGVNRDTVLENLLGAADSVIYRGDLSSYELAYSSGSAVIDVLGDSKTASADMLTNWAHQTYPEGFAGSGYANALNWSAGQNYGFQLSQTGFAQFEVQADINTPLDGPSAGYLETEAGGTLTINLSPNSAPIRRSDKIIVQYDTEQAGQFTIASPGTTSQQTIWDAGAGGEGVQHVVYNVPRAANTYTITAPGWTRIYGVYIIDTQGRVMLNKRSNPGEAAYTFARTNWHDFVKGRSFAGTVPDLAVLALGTNDADLVAYNIDQFAADIDTLVARYRAINSEIDFVFLIPNQYSSNKQQTREIHDYLVRYCRKNQFSYVDWWHLYGPYEKALALGMYSDGLHHTPDAGRLSQYALAELLGFDRLPRVGEGRFNSKNVNTTTKMHFGDTDVVMGSEQVRITQPAGNVGAANVIYDGTRPTIVATNGLQTVQSIFNGTKALSYYTGSTLLQTFFNNVKRVEYNVTNNRWGINGASLAKDINIAGNVRLQGILEADIFSGVGSASTLLNSNQQVIAYGKVGVELRTDRQGGGFHKFSLLPSGQIHHGAYGVGNFASIPFAYILGITSTGHQLEVPLNDIIPYNVEGGAAGSVNSFATKELPLQTKTYLGAGINNGDWARVALNGLPFNSANYFTVRLLLSSVSGGGYIEEYIITGITDGTGWVVSEVLGEGTVKPNASYTVTVENGVPVFYLRNQKLRFSRLFVENYQRATSSSNTVTFDVSTVSTLPPSSPAVQPVKVRFAYPSDRTVRKGTTTGTTNSNGLLLCNHTLGTTPSWIQAAADGSTMYNTQGVTSSATASDFYIAVSMNGNPVVGQTVTVHWEIDTL